MTPAFTYVPPRNRFARLRLKSAGQVRRPGRIGRGWRGTAERIDALGTLVDGDPHADVELAFAAASSGRIE